MSIKAQTSTILTEHNQKKTTGFNSLRLNYWEIKQVTSKRTTDFLDKCIEMHWMHRNLMNDDEFGYFKFLKLKYRRGDQIIQPFYRIGSSQNIRSPLFNLIKFQKPEKSTTASCKMHWNLMNDKEFGSFKLLKLKYKRKDQIIEPYCRIGSPQKIRSPLFNLRKISKTWEKYCWIM